MSVRYSCWAECPDCGLTVRATDDGKLRPHTGKAVLAGRGDAACTKPTRKTEEIEAQLYRTAAKAERQAYFASRDRDTRLPPHLR